MAPTARHTRAGGVVWGSRWAPAARPYLCAGQWAGCLGTGDVQGPRGSGIPGWVGVPVPARISLPEQLRAEFLRSHWSFLVLQVEEADSRGPVSSVGSPVLASLPCALRPSPSPPPLLPRPSPSPSEAKLASSFPLFSPLSQGSRPRSILLPCAGPKKPHRGSWKKKNPHPEEHPGPNPEEPSHFPFAGPIITRITECIYLGNLNAAYSGRVLCTNGIDSIIDVSSLPRDHSLSIIPCTCGRAGFRHSWPRLRVDIRASLHGGHHEIGQPCFLDINECIKASVEKGKRVLIHCRDGYSLGPTCVIQYLMVKHSMGLLAAYGFVRARYPLNIQECHQDLLVALEMSLQPGTASLACLKHSLSRKMAWS